MFPSKQSGEFLYEISDQDFVQQNLTISDAASAKGSKSTQRTGKGRRLKKLAAAAASNSNDGKALVSNNDDKKMMRKEIERQRRQQMAKLYAKLRSLLPLESIKGKRAVSDHMNEAVNYVNYLTKRVQELSLRRDRFKRLSNLSPLDQGSGNSSDNSSSSLTNLLVAIHPYWGGVEIVINSGVGENRSWHLSTLMLVILEEGLDVVRCVSSQTSEGFCHTIQCEISNPNHQLDLPGLQTKLYALIS